MQTRLVQLEARIQALELLAKEIAELAMQRPQLANAKLSLIAQRWYRGARELLAQQNFSGLREFESFYTVIFKDTAAAGVMIVLSHDCYDDFVDRFKGAQALVRSLLDEVLSRELPVVSQLSFAISADEFDTASELFAQSQGNEAVLRASGVVARVALERHLFTVADGHSIEVKPNPPTKKKPEAQDVLNALAKQNLITAIQKSELELLFKIGNHCAHPKETVTSGDVSRILTRGRELASIVL
jgi:hypothetical protein